MKQLLFASILAICMVGCVTKGYVPHYIVTDSKEPKPQSESLVKPSSESASDTKAAH